MQKQTRGLRKNGVTGQEREETLEKHGYGEQKHGGRSPAWRPSSGPRAGAASRTCVRRSAAPALQASCKDRATCLEGEIISQD